ncbi:MAG TPA: DNA polymerase III subunit delta' [Vicinamibacterales bacterium]|nr:DNA polymerase III subunit delta' [Vicinamibacterales bacterium]
MSLRDISGHRRLTDLLARSIERGTLPPASIFAGPAGVGKRAAAIAVAQALNCLTPKSGDACGVCAACTRIARGVHPDVLVVEPGDSGNIRIEPIREAVDRTAFKPFEGKRRAVIVDEADAMVPQAQNALLKTLEEPPASSVFILVTARPDSLLPTVRSRCIRLWFASRGTSAIDAVARAIAERVLAAAAVRDDITTRLNAAKDLLSNTGKGGAGDREQLSEYLRAMASLLRDAEILSTGADPAAIANPDARQVLDRLAGAYRGERGVKAFAAVDQGLVALDRNAGVKVVADWVALQL